MCNFYNSEERCVRGASQNPNEAINSLVWVRSSKHKHHSVKIICFAAASAVCHFHAGANSRNAVMKRLNVPTGTLTRYIFDLKDRKRLQKADKQDRQREETSPRSTHNSSLSRGGLCERWKESH